MQIFMSSANLASCVKSCNVTSAAVMFSGPAREDVMMQGQRH